jgi:hypothetical protein
VNLEFMGALLRVRDATAELGQRIEEARRPGLPLARLRHAEAAFEQLQLVLEAQAELNDFFARERGLPTSTQ